MTVKSLGYGLFSVYKREAYASLFCWSVVEKSFLSVQLHQQVFDLLPGDGAAAEAEGATEGHVFHHGEVHFLRDGLGGCGGNVLGAGGQGRTNRSGAFATTFP